MNHIFLRMLVVMKRPGFQSQRYSMPKYGMPIRNTKWES